MMSCQRVVGHPESGGPHSKPQSWGKLDQKRSGWNPRKNDGR